MNKLQRFAMRAPIGLFRVGLGGLLARRFLLLEHVGRTSGQLREAVLEILETDEQGVPVIASGFGLQAQWYKNVSVNSEIFYTRGRRRTAATADRISHSDAVEVFRRYQKDHPRAARAIGKRLEVPLTDDPHVAAREIPLFQLSPRDSVSQAPVVA
ncbi:MAG: deazaflavin-dependent oxidoreductase (nitroreductase family) [Candidatus Aldehydirespiratoraceae bacterium]|jgi:deazaflavin-dependent oxidoreductase (nitroreductase family)